ncbi:tetratricopeptide repeat protein [Rurimicrobium arvi]|uniref:Tetratricopeptide repeat protein n=1 Tax=Rurimicrobium arvi TaxID=2049916 RepID=A0ABP8MF40_9BACT
MKKLLILIFLSLFAGRAESADVPAATLWQQGNTAYQQKNYEASIAAYEALLRQQPHTAEVYFNLGNAFYRSNKVAEAVLQYERARFCNPSLQGVADNILLAQQRIPNALKSSEDIFFVRWWQLLSAGNKAGMWAFLGLAVFLALLGFILIANTRNKYRSFAPQVYLLGGFTLSILLLLAFTSAHNARSTDKAVVMNSAAVMVPEPGQTKGQIIIPQATVVHMGEARGQWVAVELPDSRSGWMSLSDITPVQNNGK